MGKELYKNITSFFNCRASQILNELINENKWYPTLFYNMLENTDDIYEHLFIKRKHRWIYPNPKIWDNMTAHNIKAIESKKKSYYELELTLLDLFDDGIDKIYIWANNDFLPYRKIGVDYTRPGSMHSVILKGYIREGSDVKFLLEDLDSPGYSDYVSNEVIENAIFTDTDNSPIAIMYIRMGQVHDYNKIENNTLKLFKEYITSYNEKYYFYKRFLAYSSGDKTIKDFKNNNETFELLIQMFSMISGSRYLLLKYVDVHYPETRITLLLQQSSSLAEQLKNIFLRANIIGVYKYNNSSVYNMCHKLMELEKELILELKQIVL